MVLPWMPPRALMPANAALAPWCMADPRSPTRRAGEGGALCNTDGPFLCAVAAQAQPGQADGGGRGSQQLAPGDVGRWAGGGRGQVGGGGCLLQRPGPAQG